MPRGLQCPQGTVEGTGKQPIGDGQTQVRCAGMAPPDLPKRKQRQPREAPVHRSAYELAAFILARGSCVVRGRTPPCFGGLSSLTGVDQPLCSVQYIVHHSGTGAGRPMNTKRALARGMVRTYNSARICAEVHSKG